MQFNRAKAAQPVRKDFSGQSMETPPARSVNKSERLHWAVIEDSASHKRQTNLKRLLWAVNGDSASQKRQKIPKRLYWAVNEDSASQSGKRTHRKMKGIMDTRNAKTKTQHGKAPSR
jgi:hypothetical protein